MDNLFNKSKEFVLDLFFPRFCFSCKKEGFYLCDDCRALLDIAEFNYCLCDSPALRLAIGSKTGKCNRCQNKKLSGLYFALPYKQTLTKKLVYQFKYQPYLKDLAKTLASILAEHFVISGKNTDEIWKNSILVPIPLDKKKLKNRGYNQTEELAKELSKIIQVPMISDLLVKLKSTKPQMELSKTEREKNLAGTFAVKPVFAPELRGGKVFLVDDVYTTGATMEECCLALKRAGAKSVWGIALAREE